VYVAAEHEILYREQEIIAFVVTENMILKKGTIEYYVAAEHVDLYRKQ
jgi:hypothetical protein